MGTTTMTRMARDTKNVQQWHLCPGSRQLQSNWTTRPIQWERIHAWYCKPDQEPTAGEAMEPRDKPLLSLS